MTAVLRPEVLAYLSHADDHDANLFGQEGYLGLMPAVLGGEPKSGVRSVGRPAAGMGRRELCQRNDVEHGRFHRTGTTPGQRDFLGRLSSMVHDVC